jgi:signal transduction histidine kinase
MAEELKILIIDDEPGMRTGAIRALKNFTVDLPDVNQTISFALSEAEDAEKGLELIESDPPQILLLDHKLPGMSGLDLLEKLNLQKLDMLVVMITAYASIDTAIHATKQGAYDFLAKPFSPVELRNMIEKASSRIIFQRQAKQLAEEKKRVRFEFISVLAHELKSPINAIQGYLDIMHNKVVGEDIGSYEKMIDRSLIRLDGMRKLIFDLLDMTRIESQEKKREFGDVDLLELAEMCIESVQTQADDRNIKINLTTEEGLQINADRGEIEIILNNLISNSVKYNKDNGNVDVNIAKTDKKIVIRVKDTGIGMNEAESAKLFNDFVRIRNEKTKSITGSGLGLSVVKKLAQLYNGDVRVESAPDKGSTFVVELYGVEDGEDQN